MQIQSRYQKGDKIAGRYQVHDVKMGGMGEVYLCLDLETIQPYALKTFQQRYLTAAQQLRQSFEREVATWVALEKHPHIVRCFYMDILDNQPFMILEWIAGEEGKGTDLRGWLRRGPPDLQLALDFTIDIVRGLIHAQEKQPGIVHRDLKPENILVAQGRWAKITDFGLAQIVQEADLKQHAAKVEAADRQSMVNYKGIAGTPLYMAPEQWRGEHLDERTDVYALGCMLYEMLTGTPPFQVNLAPTSSQGFQQWLSKMKDRHEHNRVPSLPRRISARLKDLEQTCLAKARAERPSLSELLHQLEEIYQQQFTVAPRVSPPSGEFTAKDYNNRGNTYVELQHYEEALRDLNHAIELDSQLMLAYLNRSRIYKEMQQYAKALQDLNYAIELEPGYAMSYNNRGAIYIELQRYNRAQADLDRAIDLDPHLALAHYNRGEMCMRQQRYAESVNHFNRALRIEPDAKTYTNRGLAYINLNNAEDALSDFNQAIQLDPTYALAHFNMGAFFYNNGAPQKALPFFEEAAQLGLSQAAQLAARIRRESGKQSGSLTKSTQQAFQAFQGAASPAEMQRAVAQYPLLTQADFIITIEQAITQQVPPRHRPVLEQRLAWLKRIVRNS